MTSLQSPQKRTGRIENIEMLTHTTFQLTICPTEPFSFEAGQFISILLPIEGKARALRRAYSIASPPEDPLLKLWIKHIPNGIGSNELFRKKKGSLLTFYAPYGHLVYKNQYPNTCFIATGTGVAPFHSLLFSKKYQTHRPKKTYLFFGSRHEKDILLQETFSSLPIQYEIAISQPSSHWKGFHGRLTDFFKKNILPQKSFPLLQTDFYLCGNGAMIQEIKDLLLKQNVLKEHIFQEIYYKP